MKKICRLLLSLAVLSGASIPAISQLTPAFSSDTTEGCAPLVIKFKDLSAGNPNYWRWDMGNGSVLYVQDPATTYLEPGIYTVKLFINDGNGEKSIVKTNYIKVYPTPVARFDASTTTGCFPLPVKFHDLSSPESGSLIKWEWDFGDGFTSNKQNPEHIYDAIGNYHVVLRVTNSHGCTNTIPKLNYIKITTGAIADFTLSAPANCNPPTIVNFADNSNATGTVFYKWSFGDGGTSTDKNPSHTYTTSGSYPVSLTISNDFGCENKVVKTDAITIGSVRADFNIPVKVCAGQPFTPQNLSSPSPTGASWDFGNGDTINDIQPTYTYPKKGIFTITLQSKFGACGSTISKSIEVLDKPVVDFSVDKNQYCQAPFPVNFSVQTTETLTYKWDFGDGQSSTDKNPAHIYQYEGDFNVTLVATNSIGCSETITKNGFLSIRRPKINFGFLADKACLPFNVKPVAQINAPETISTYKWVFGDGHVSTDANPDYTYTTAGTYIITLIFTTESGCTDSAKMAQIKLGDKPNLNFNGTPKNTCAFLPVMFSDLSSSPPVDEWLWKFGDGGISDNKNPAHNYTDTGYFDITLTGWSNGCADTLVKKDFIHISGPIAKFTDSVSCEGPFKRYFKDFSIDAHEWSWDFGDGSTSTDPNPQHTFSGNGEFLVTLTVKNDTCQHSTSQMIQVYGDKKDFSTVDTAVCTNVPVKFTTTGIVGIGPDSPPFTFWDFGDGNMQSGQLTMEHAYDRSGIYSVKMTVRDIFGCLDTIVKPLYIKVAGPHAGFTAPVATVCSNVAVVFSDTSSSALTAPIVSWFWDYGDGITETKTSGPFEHAYKQAGSYTVTLTVTDNIGCTSSAVQNSGFKISTPTSVFESQDIQSCTNKPIQFSNSSYGNITRYDWSFGNGQTSTDNQPLIQYDTEGAYDISLITTDNFGCRDTLVKTAYINIRDPRALFEVSDSVATCPPLMIEFTNKSQNFISYDWNFGDNTRPAPNENPTHYYALPGTYIARLKITSAGGCMDSMSQKLIVKGPEGKFTYDVISGCKPVTIKFKGNTTSDASFVWDYNDGSVEAGGYEITHTYTKAGAYLPSMILVDPQGCRVPFPGTDTIKVYGVNAAFTASTQLLCDSGEVIFTNNSTANEPITYYHWTFAEGQETNQENPTYYYRAQGNYSIQLIVTSMSGCRDTVVSEIPVTVAEKPIINITGDSLVCMPATVQFNGIIIKSDSSALSWEWNFGNGSTAYGQNPVAAIFREEKNYDVQAIATNSFGCKDTMSKTVLPLPLPEVNAGEDKTISSGSSVQLIPTHTQDVTSYNWSPSEGLSCTNCKEPVASPKRTTTYTIGVTNQQGCTSSDDVNISVFCNDGNLFMPNTFSPNGDGVNDIFYPRGKGLFTVKVLRVFNRWGEVVFEKHDFRPNDISKGWNGIHNGRPASQDVYVYSVDLVCENNTILNYKGNIALIR